MVREPNEADEQVWRGATTQSFVARGLGALRAVVMVVAAGDFPGDADDHVPAAPTTDGAFRAELLTGALDGTPADRLLVEGTSVLRSRSVTVRGRVSLPEDGLLWQPDRDDDRGLLVRNDEVDAVVVGLPGRGVLVHLRDGRLGLALGRRDHDRFVEALRSRFG